MKLSENIDFKNFQIKKNKKKINSLKKKLISLCNEKNEIIASLSKKYKNSFKNNEISKYKNFFNYRIIGMGGSSLGAKAIYNFLKHKIKKKFYFIDNLINERKLDKKRYLNIIISKSGQTIETIVNSNLLIKKNSKNIFITENKPSYLYSLAEKLKSEIVHHNNYIGGRYSVLSEVGMLPAELMGLSQNNFKQFNSIIKNKFFFNNLVLNVYSIIKFIKDGKFNSIILNYDHKSESLFSWYQQLIAESLGKKNKGLLPIVSNMPKDNHSVMQLYLDGFKSNFYTFFHVKDNQSTKLNNNLILEKQNYLKNKSVNKIKLSQKKATEIVFAKKNIPFRSFSINNRNEKVLGELFSFFILETILVGQSLKINPYDQPSVELIKKETNKLLF